MKLQIPRPQQRHLISPSKLVTFPSQPLQAPQRAKNRRARPRRWAPMASSRQREKEKVVVIMGATGTGKSRLSVDLASVFPSEIINSDKMQVYNGLDITTNKITMEERRGVPHHLMGFFDPANGELSPSGFRSLGHSVIADISSRDKLPVVAGGSNSFAHALLTEQFDPTADVFTGRDGAVSSELRYNCCFIWVDVAFPALNDYLVKRVDDMLSSGMFEELQRYFDSEPDAFDDSVARTGLRKAIGVPEFSSYFKRFPPSTGAASLDSDSARWRAYREAVKEIKDNTCQLAKRQIEKIQRLRDAGWALRRLDCTEAIVAASDQGGRRRWAEIWESQVLQPSVAIVRRFLEE